MKDSEPVAARQLSKSDYNRYYVIGYFLVILVAVFQRGSLALVNREANDNHYEVMQLLSEGFRSLNMENCRECFHPKLYYVVCVTIFKTIGVSGANAQIVTAQLLNCVAGVMTLAVVWLGLREQRAGKLSLFLTFAWVALNPRFIGINGQASNDSFAILFATIAIFFTWRLLRYDRSTDFLFAQLALSCAILSKGTSWPAAIAIIIVLIARSIFRPSCRGRYAIYTMICLGVCAISVKYGDYDFKSYDTYANLGKGKPLGLFERTVVGRPGVISIADSYLTFRFIDLLKNPMNTRGQELKPMHRSSVWTQLYGRLHCVQFDYHPSSWRTQSEVVKNLNRVIFVIAIGWMVVAFLGVAKRLLVLAKGLRNRGTHYLASGDKYFHLLVVAGYTAFIVYFTYSYRDFAAMKTIYMFPGLLSFAVMLQEGVRLVLRALGRHENRIGVVAFISASLFLCVLYTLNVELLIEHLERSPLHI